MIDFKVIGEKRGFETKDPETSIAEIAEYVKTLKYDEIGVASFGPICLNRQDRDYGSITTPPKLKWEGYPLLKELKR